MSNLGSGKLRYLRGNCGIALGLVGALVFVVGRVGAEPLSRAQILEGIDERIETHRKAEIELVLRDPSGELLPAGTLVSVEQTEHSFLFGANLFLLGRADTPGQEATYRERFAELFNFATLPFYWWSYEREQGKPDVKRIETILSWTEEQGIRTKGHPLAWNFVDPLWLPDNIQFAQQLQMDRIERIVKQFQGRIDVWDVVNEATSAEREETLNRSPILTRVIQGIGIRQYLQLAFQRARLASSKATLIINDYEVGEDFRTTVVDELSDSHGQPLFDVIGIQSHQHRGPWSVEKIWEVCERFAPYNKPLHFTETTFLSGEPGWYLKRERKDFNWESTEEGEARQAAEVELFYRVLFSHPSVDAITWWDFSDQKAWQEAPAGLIRKDMSPKPAYSTLKRLIKQNWMTRIEAQLEAGGRLHFRGFKGTYVVEVPSQNQTRVGFFRLDSGSTGPVTVVLGEVTTR